MADTVVERFLRYAAINTQADPDANERPSSPGQVELATLLRTELKDLGLRDARVIENGVVVATLHTATGAAASATISRSTQVDAPLPSVVYERYPNAAVAPLRPEYVRREPESSTLYTIIRTHLETFLEQPRDSGTGYPSFIEREFRRYLDCGLLCRGFARVRCPQCGHERLLALSCKSRLCPSCWGRRMSDTAAHLVDRLLPAAPYRQWVLTFAYPLRFHLARDKALLSAMLRGFLRTLFAWQRRQGRAVGICDGQSGAVTFIQRFGSAL